MRGYLLQKLATLALTLFAASIVVFILLDLAPGDPAAYMMGLNADPQALAALRTELGLDQPAWTRYATWIAGLLHGDFGVSYTYRVPVASLLAERSLVSLPLALFALLLSTGAAIGLAVLIAIVPNRFLKASVLGFAQIGLATPNFWVAILLVQIFASWLGWFSAGGFPGWDSGVGPALHALVLPAIAMALPQSAILLRVAHAAMLESQNEPYVVTARAKGLSPPRVVLGHILPNALIPILTILGLQFTFLLAGAVIIENAFYLPGLGRLVLQAVTQRDLIVVRAVVMLLVFAAVVVTFAIDLLYALADPRVRDGAVR